MFQDYLLYATDVEMRYALRVVHLSQLVQEAITQHQLNEHRGRLLGEALVAGCLLSSLLEEEERINLRVQCGDEYTLATETSRHAETRGYFEAVDGEFIQSLDRGEEPVAALMVRSLRAMPEPGQIFEGITKFLTNSLEEAFNDHLQHSFQVKAKLKLDCWKHPEDGQWRAYGVVYMELPNLAKDVRTELWQHVMGLPLLREVVGKSDDPDSLATKLIPHLFRPIRSVKPSWSCRCSQQSVEKMLISLPVEELQEMVRDAKPLEIRCHYCNKNYNVTNERQKELLASMVPEAGQSHLKN
jgi:molecular chaperone Hsp33